MLNIEQTKENRVRGIDARYQVASSQDVTWYKDAIIYQLHVKSFFDSNNDGIGDFPGLISKLDYIASLGVNTIWLLPFYPSPLRDDGYDIADYYGVHSDYGSIEDVQRFIDEAHARGLRIITELVINHTSDQHPWFQRARKAPPGSPEREFYVWSDDDKKYAGTRIIFLDTEKSNWSWDTEANAYFWHRFYSHQPDLNFDNPEVLKAMLDAMNYWLAMGVDGLRLDAVPYLVEREGTNNENLPETHQVLKRIRAEVDEKFPGRLLLAEANQWPEDTQEYFGDGDECHMAFHFPLMPRMYMALAQEDRFPITDILRQTPVIPETCQWAIFLRNHDELTLEMVTDRERDYLWDQYASDGRARLNLGIRRRLAPLVQRDRRRIELLNSLLFSMPGTPVIYYGDELCMGDNIYLGDRDGVRTPMQWSPDRNGGFSRADPSRLVLPAVMDPLYGYSAINVEAQARDTHSVLNWMRLMLDVRKQHLSFGRGTFKMLYPANRRILAYTREYRYPDTGEVETILCLANMARSAQAVELELSAYNGLVPLEMTGGSTFPPVGELNYLLTLPPYGFYWFLLAHETKYPEWYTPPPEPMPDFVTLVLRSGVLEALHSPLQDQLEQDILPEYLAKRRWFCAKGKTIDQVRLLHQSALLPPVESAHADAEGAVLTELEVQVGGETHWYQIPLVVLFEEDRVSALVHQLTLARVRRRDRVGVLTDAVASDDLTKSIVALLYAGLDTPEGQALSQVSSLPSDHADVIFKPTGELRKLALDAPDLEIRTLAVEQSNSSVIIGESAVLKLYRRLFSGSHPEVEMGNVLTEGGFANTAPMLGHVCRVSAQGEVTALAMLQGYIPNQGNGWEWMLEHLDRLNEDRASLASPELSEADIEADISSQEHDMLAELERFSSAIGKRLGEMHGVLARASERPDFAPEQADESTCDQWGIEVQQQLEQAFGYLHRLDRTGLDPQDQRRLEALLQHRDQVLQLVRQLADMGKGSLVFRIHGDLHLGQILVAQDDAYFIDFEGEPTRPLHERLGKSSPYRDVAGVLRSLQYVAATAAEHTSVVDNDRAFEQHQAFLTRFHESTTKVFNAAYQEAAREIPHAWHNSAGRRALKNLFCLEKAAYEVVYEANNRPDWVHIPLHGLLDIAQRQGISIDSSRLH